MDFPDIISSLLGLLTVPADCVSGHVKGITLTKVAYFWGGDSQGPRGNQVIIPSTVF